MRAAREPVRFALLEANGPMGKLSNEGGPLPWLCSFERVIEEYRYFRNLLDRFLPETVWLIFFQERKHLL
ncbi:hypothetical protein J14TS5_58840 [Paenibacillus lautus]|nr:hypothetical protein J14TS5_58840 [Paenibacillus lautus]